MWVQSLGQEDPLEQQMATHPGILAWEIPWTEESGRLQSMGLQKVRHNCATEHTQSFRGEGYPGLSCRSNINHMSP